MCLVTAAYIILKIMLAQSDWAYSSTISNVKFIVVLFLLSKKFLVSILLQDCIEVALDLYIRQYTTTFCVASISFAFVQILIILPFSMCKHRRGQGLVEPGID